MVQASTELQHAMQQREVTEGVTAVGGGAGELEQWSEVLKLQAVLEQLEEASLTAACCTISSPPATTRREGGSKEEKEGVRE